MTKDEVLQMAREAGEALEGEWQMGGLSNGLYMDYACEVALAVAHLVEQRTREEIADSLEHGYMDDEGHHIQYAKEIRVTSTLQASKVEGR